MSKRSAKDSSISTIAKPASNALEAANPALAGLRRFAVNGFPKYLIFYRATEGELRIVRIIHGARDIRNVLEADEQT